jgi:hypothetical protein
MEANNLGSIGLVEVASKGVANLCPQLIERVSLGEDGFAQGASDEPSFRSFLDGENKLRTHKPSGYCGAFETLPPHHLGPAR